MKRSFILFALLLLLNKAFSQDQDLKYFITGNGNLYIPINNPEKGMYPILWYDKQTDSKILIGGIGMGVLATKTWGKRSEIRGQVNVSKHTYWEAFGLRTNTNMPSGAFTSGSSDYALGVTGIAHYFLSGKLSAGAGLGFQAMLLSFSRTPFQDGLGKQFYRNRHYRPLMPVLPIELSYTAERKIFNIRYEQGLLNRLRGDAREYRKDYFGILTFELGFNLKNEEVSPEYPAY